ncbi:hypothetical protein FOVG_19951 [Fusarium oxysporum f. sp. pisi HDV247]|uniref:Uncharacterized protein n=1 Tax=Fusarium oxysporum f. sp. pisi HDV247 TaxID=1080344 RepID=W9NKP1_FUSOX|nr:hypothetical protein FOVG_19951 [Fusarium oxysporum f. sp. pisi HDV247]
MANLHIMFFESAKDPRSLSSEDFAGLGDEKGGHWEHTRDRDRSTPVPRTHRSCRA